MLAVAAGVQNLHQNFAASLMYRIDQDFVIGNLVRAFQGVFIIGEPARLVGPHPTGNHQCNPIAGPLREKSTCFSKTVVHLFEQGMHGAHHHPIR